LDFSSGNGAAVDGPPELTDAALLDAIWREANDRSIPAAARIQALDKVQRMRERMSGGSGPEDIPAELASFIALVKGKTLEECDKML